MNAATALRKQLARNAALYASTTSCVHAMIGAVRGARPSRCSENASTPGAGKNAGAFHQDAVRGITRVEHQRIQALSSGSMGSDGTALRSVSGSGHV